jgi:hypothetical protein
MEGQGGLRVGASMPGQTGRTSCANPSTPTAAHRNPILGASRASLCMQGTDISTRTTKDRFSSITPELTTIGQATRAHKGQGNFDCPADPSSTFARHE